jgi:uncharacterized membrane protein
MIAIGMLIGLQAFAWILKIDGAVTATIFGLIGLIAGSIFGFEYGSKGKVE